jgi:glycosyl-4,4'-diaponeurosporenoate acyltransferase
VTAETFVVVAADAAVWAGWSLVVGSAAHRIPPDRLARDGRVTRIRAWERSGRVYEALGIRRWKDRLPELGAVLGSADSRGYSLSKRRVPGRGPTARARFAAETRRAELVHWAVPAVLPLFAVWNPPALFAAMAAYAVLANLPCLVVQRYNRVRLLRIATLEHERGLERERSVAQEAGR